MTSETTLLTAVREGDRDTVERLLAETPTLAAAHDPQTGVSAILLALYHGHRPIAESLADARPEISLHEAAALGRIASVAAALAGDREAIDRPGADGFRPLGLAAFFGHGKVLGLLLERGADPSLPADNSMRVTALHSAVAIHDAVSATANATRLLEHDAPIDATQQGGWTALHAAAMRGNAALVEVLLAHGADRHLGNDEGRTAEQLAREAGHEQVAARLARP